MKKILLSLAILIFVSCMPSTPVEYSSAKNCGETLALTKGVADVSSADTLNETQIEEELPQSSCAE